MLGWAAVHASFSLHDICKLLEHCSLSPVPGKLPGSNQVLVNGYFQLVNPKDRKASKMESCGKEALRQKNMWQSKLNHLLNITGKIKIIFPSDNLGILQHVNFLVKF